MDGLVVRDPGLDLIHVRDVGLAAVLDPIILEWAAVEERVLLTHDRRTIPPFAYARVDSRVEDGRTGGRGLEPQMDTDRHGSRMKPARPGSGRATSRVGSDGSETGTGRITGHGPIRLRGLKPRAGS